MRWRSTPTTVPDSPTSSAATCSQPPPGGAEVDDGVAALEQVRLLVDLFQLVGRPGAYPCCFDLL